MKKTVLAAVMAMLITVAGLLVWFLAANLRGGYAGAFRLQFDASVNAELLKEEEASLKEIETLIVEGSWQDITFKASDTDVLRVLHYGAKNTPEDRLFSISKDGNVLRVTASRDFRLNIGFNIAREEVVMLMPIGWKGRVEALSSSGSLRLEQKFNWGDVLLNTSSGDIRLGGIDCGELSIDASSGTVRVEGGVRAAGDIKIGTNSGSVRLTGVLEGENIYLTASSGNISSQEEITSASFSASAMSGDIRLGNLVRAEGLKLSTSSGNIRAAKIDAKTYDIYTNSGSVNIEGVSGDGQLKSSSGDIKTVLLAPVGEVTAETSSGSVRLTLPTDLSFSFSGKTSSGSIKADFDMLYRDPNGKEATASVGGDPTAYISALSSSGAIYVYRGR